jgi:hypothetical protein
VNHLEATKTVASTSFGTAATLVVDTLGHDYMSVDAIYGPGTATVAKANTFTLRAADTVAGLADYTGTYSVAGATALATSVTYTSVSTVVRADFDLRGKPRYIEVGTTTPDTAARVVVVARLGKSEKGADTAADKGAAIKFTG